METPEARACQRNPTGCTEPMKRAASHRDRMVPEGGEVRQENSKSGMRYRPKENGIITDFLRNFAVEREELQLDWRVLIIFHT